MSDNRILITKLLKEKTEGTPVSVQPTDNVNNKKETPNPSKYEKIRSLLSNEIFNHAAIMRQLGWEGKEDTNRSLFRKKLNMEPNDTGGVYEFDEADLLKISDILMRTSSQIKKSVGRNGQA